MWFHARVIAMVLLLMASTTFKSARARSMIDYDRAMPSTHEAGLVSQNEDRLADAPIPSENGVNTGVSFPRGIDGIRRNLIQDTDDRPGCELFEHPNFQGRRIVVSNVVERLTDIAPDWNDIVSSARTSPGCMLFMWEHYNKKGSQYVMQGDRDTLPKFWNDRVSSTRCVCNLLTWSYDSRTDPAWRFTSWGY